VNEIIKVVQGSVQVGSMSLLAILEQGIDRPANQIDLTVGQLLAGYGPGGGSAANQTITMPQAFGQSPVNAGKENRIDYFQDGTPRGAQSALSMPAPWAPTIKPASEKSSICSCSVNRSGSTMMTPHLCRRPTSSLSLAMARIPFVWRYKKAFCRVVFAPGRG